MLKVKKKWMNERHVLFSEISFLSFVVVWMLLSSKSSGVVLMEVYHWRRALQAYSPALLPVCSVLCLWLKMYSLGPPNSASCCLPCHFELWFSKDKTWLFFLKLLLIWVGFFYSNKTVTELITLYDPELKFDVQMFIGIFIIIKYWKQPE